MKNFSINRYFSLLIFVTLNWHCKFDEVKPLIADFTYQSGTIYTIVPITFTDASVGAKTWEWDFGNGQFSNSQSPPAQSYLTEGTYVVKLTVSNGNGGSNSKSINLHVEKHPVVIAAFTAPTFAKKDESVHFMNNSLFATSYQWDFGNGLPTSTETDPIISFPTTGSKNITLTASNIGGSAVETKTIEICDIPIASFSTSAGSFNTNTNIVFSNTSNLNASENFVSYLWTFGDGTTSDQKEPTHAYSLEGDYTLLLKVTNQCGEDWSVSKTITILDINMKSIPNGTFAMGCNENVDNLCDPVELPKHNVIISTFYISDKEVTQNLWQKIMGSNPSYFGNCSACPVEQISWFDAIVFCNRLSELQGLEPCYYSTSSYSSVFGKNNGTWTLPNSGLVFFNIYAKGYRLPTEAEWERAARDGVNDQIYSGGNDIELEGWYNWNSGYISNPVGQKPLNGTPNYKLFDMSGNVGEWCYDWFSNYNSITLNNPTGPQVSPIGERIIRGGSFGDYSYGCRVSKRTSLLPDDRIQVVGLRLARSL